MVTPLLDAFSVYPTPQSPLHRGSNLTLRCQYYEVFLINSVFSASGCLLCALEYALGARLAMMQHRRLTVQLAVFLAMSLPYQLCILDYPFADYRTFLLPFLAVGWAAALAALAHRQWLSRSRSSSSSSCDSTLPLTANPLYAIDAAYLTGENRHFNPLLAGFRSVLYICTALCIFSRDLPCWNNRLSKSKAFGTGVMDMGIGCFVVCLGTVGPTAIRPAHLVHPFRAIRRSFRQALLLSCLGLLVSLDRARQFSSLMAALREEATAAPAAATNATTQAPRRRFPAEWREYGVHWNAFHSLAVARLLGASLELLALPRWAPPLLAAAAVAAAHETALASGLAELVLAPGTPEPHNRAGLIGQNREGLASVPGLLTLYLAGLQLGRWTREWSEGRVTTAKVGRWMRWPTSAKMLTLLVATLAWRPLVLATSSSVLPESRRLMSSAYCAWVVAFTCACLLTGRLLMQLRWRLCAGRCLQLRHLASFDRAGALGFLVGNVATGLFNASLDTAAVNREAVIGGPGRLCFLVALAYSLGTHAIALRLRDVRWTAAAVGMLTAVTAAAAAAARAKAKQQRSATKTIRSV